jgi:AraC-like DNA-binding protein
MGVLAEHTRIGGLVSNLPQEYFRYLPISERDTQWDLYVTGGLASTFHMSYAHFRRVFKQQSGLSPYQYHLQLRIHRAREMLHSTTLAVGQVAARLNFPNPYYFSKIFKKKTGMSPSLWRRGGREKM